MQKLQRFSLYTFYFLLAYMPLHIFLSTWVGTSFGVLDFAKVAKDVLMVVGFLAALAVSFKQAWFKDLLKDKLVWLILAFAGLNLILAVFRPTDPDAELLGLVYNTRFLLFFLYGILLTKLAAGQNLMRRALKIVLAVATIVLFFGVVQYAVLPDDALEKFGYSRANGVLPVFFIDDKQDLERAMSTLRDPNSFGSYIIIISSIVLAYLILSKNRSVRQITAWLLVLSILCLAFTFSRSAWLGFVVAAVITILLCGNRMLRLSARRKKILIVSSATLVIALAGGLFMLRNDYYVQNFLLHTSSENTAPSSNVVRNQYWQSSITDIKNNPLGEGPGRAGPASMHNDVQGTNINENYYLQMAHELGVFGLLLFLGILLIVGKRLYGLYKQSPLIVGLLASFIGLAITNFFVHIWANEAVAYTWWGLAGLVLFTAPESSAAVHGKAKSQSA